MGLCSVYNGYKEQRISGASNMGSGGRPPFVRTYSVPVWLSDSSYLDKKGVRHNQASSFATQSGQISHVGFALNFLCPLSAALYIKFVPWI